MKRHPVLNIRVLRAIIIILSLFCTDLTIAANTPSPTHPGKTDSAESVHAVLSKMSDEQVRQMLIAELKKDAATEDSTFSLELETEGPAAPMARMLKILDNKSEQSEHQLDKLWQGIPDLFPDLYRVFVSL